MVHCPSYIIEEWCGLLPLEKRQEAADVIFIYKLVNNMTDCPEILGKVSWRIPVVNTQGFSTFYILYSFSRNYQLKSNPLIRIFKSYNKVFYFYFYFDSFIKLKHYLTIYQ